MGALPNTAISSLNWSTTPLKKLQSAQRDRLGLRQRGQDAVAACDVQRRVDAAGNGPGRMDALAGQALDHLLPEPAQRDAVLGKLRMVLDHADDVAPCRIGVEAEQQVGRREMEEAQRVGLDDLAAMHDLAQLRRGRRNAHAHDGFARLGRGEQVADRADAADARGDRRHFVERPALAEFLEPAKLGDVELRVGDVAVVVEMDGDLRVTLDAGDRVDDDGLHELLLSRNALAPQIGNAPIEKLGEDEQDRRARTADSRARAGRS